MLTKLNDDGLKVHKLLSWRKATRTNLIYLSRKEWLHDVSMLNRVDSNSTVVTKAEQITDISTGYSLKVRQTDDRY